MGRNDKGGVREYFRDDRKIKRARWSVPPRPSGKCGRRLLAVAAFAVSAAAGTALLLEAVLADTLSCDSGFDALFLSFLELLDDLGDIGAIITIGSGWAVKLP